MYAIIKPYCTNYIDTQDFDVIIRHRDINKAAAAVSRDTRIVVMDGDKAARTVSDISSEPGYNPYG